MEGNLFRSEAEQEHNEAFLLKQKPSPGAGTTGANPNETGCFDCNICLDTAHDPVVTLCGHLFCWPCIYKWLHVQVSSVSPHPQQNCPVCKTNISITSLVPLYGRGTSSSTFGPKKHDHDPENLIIPNRPSPSALNNLNPSMHDPYQPQSPSFHHRQQYSPRSHAGFTTTESTDLANAVIMSFLNPVIGMFGDLVYTRVFGTFTNQTPPYSISGNTQRMRRQDMQLEKSLHRVSIFLLCCIVLCLLLF